MRVYDLGAHYRVAVSQSDVETFASRWPGFGAPVAFSFSFSKRTGDLIDLYHAPAEERMDLEHNGVAVLCENAMIYGALRLRLSGVLSVRSKELRDYRLDLWRRLAKQDRSGNRRLRP